MTTKKKLRFYPKAHTYWVGKTKLDSVTTWIGSFFEPFDEKGIAKKVAYWRRKKGGKDTMTSVIKEWKLQTHQGTLVHEAMEHCLLGDTERVIESTRQMNDYGQSRWVGGLEWLKDNGEYTSRDDLTIECEKRIYSEDLRLAGTIDVLIRRPDGAIGLIDWKTNKNLTKDKIEKYTLQLSTYAYILEKEYGEVVTAMAIVHLTDCGYKGIDIGYAKEEIEKMLKVSDRL